MSAGRQIQITRLLVVAGGLAVCLASKQVRADGDYLASRPALKTPAVIEAKLGDEIRTRIGQRRRLSLPGGCALYVNADTRLKIVRPEEINLSAGEIYVEIPARENPLSIKTPRDRIQGSAGNWGVRVKKNGTAVMVARGSVRVNGKSVSAGQQILPGKEPNALPRASHLLDWTRELMAAAESPLVPASTHAGGDLIAFHPDGQEARISLRNFHIDVHVEDGFARTTIDQTYFNHENVQLEGTFYFPLPAEASLSRLAMYVNGLLMEGGMAERNYAAQVYESIRYARRDPALLEWVDGTTFKMRVFPMEPRTEKRIILSYTQKLPSLYGQASYRFPAGHSLQKVAEWSFRTRIKDGSDLAWTNPGPGPGNGLSARREGNDLVLESSAAKASTSRDVVFTYMEKAPAKAHFSTFEQDGSRYLMLRYRPNLSNAGTSKPAKRTWLFLFESSGDRNPLLARAQIEIVRNILARAEPADEFLVATGGTRLKLHGTRPQSATAGNIRSAIEFLERAHLIGALDMGKALKEMAGHLPAGGETYLVHLGTGIPAMGERRADMLVKLLPPQMHYVGIGVGRRWNRSFMKAAAEHTAGYYTQINPDEPIAWRAFDLVATLNTPRLLNVEVEALDGQTEYLTMTSVPGRPKFLLFDQATAQGEEICAVTRVGPIVGEPDHPRHYKFELPRNIVVRGTLAGKPIQFSLPVPVNPVEAGHLPRTWAKLEIDRLLAEDAAQNKEHVIALSKSMYVMTPFTSLLVLENEDMYVQNKVDRGRKDHWAMYPSPAKIPVVYEPEEGQGDPKTIAGKPAAWDILKSIRIRGGTEFRKEKRRKTILRSGESKEEREELGGGFGIPRPALAIIPSGSEIPTGSLMFGDGKKTKNSYVGNVIILSDEIEITRDQKMVFAQTDIKKHILAGKNIMAVNDGAPILSSKMSLLNVSEDLHQIGGEWNRFLQIPSPAKIPVIIRPSKSYSENGDYSVLFENQTPQSFIFNRPKIAFDPKDFYDLTSYAPGMNTNLADIQGILEAEARPGRFNISGKIDPGVRELFARAKAPGWKVLEIPEREGQAGLIILFDGQGRYAYQRRLPPGIEEKVYCDGRTIMHVYPQLGIGARRPVTRFHRADLAELVPWYLPPAEDLARDGDLKMIDNQTVAIVPHQHPDIKAPEKWYELHLVFGNDGRLAERRVLRMPKKEIVYRQIISADGTVTLKDGKDKELSLIKGKLRPAQAPKWKEPDSKFVILPLPYRTPEHIKKILKPGKKEIQNLTLKEALPLFAAEFAAGNADGARTIFQSVFHARNQRQLGFYVLLAACGANLDSQNLDVLAEHPDEPLAQYLALHSSPVLRQHASQWAVRSAPWQEEYLQHLALTHALLQRWQNDRVVLGMRDRVLADRKKALDYIHKHKDSPFAWTLLCLMQDRAAEAHGPMEKAQGAKPIPPKPGTDLDFYRELAEAFCLFEKAPGLDYAARYEHARCLWKAGMKMEARKKFQELYRATLARDVLPAIDADFRSALLGSGPDPWSELMQATSKDLIAKKHRPAALALARQCWQLDDPPLAESLLDSALAGIKDADERTRMTLAGILFLKEAGKFPQADQLLQSLLADPKLAGKADLWRLAMELAEKRDMTARAMECLEKALDAEFHKLPGAIDLKEVEADYGKLMEHYQNLADAMVALKLEPPVGFLAKVVRVADRWRALDGENAQPCRVAAAILKKFGDRDLGWDYLTTPVAHKPAESSPWLELAGNLQRQGDLDLADRAFQAAFEAEPTNAQILWDRAQNLKQAGKTVPAREIFRQIAGGTWQPRFLGLQSQARAMLMGP